MTSGAHGLSTEPGAVTAQRVKEILRNPNESYPFPMKALFDQQTRQLTITDDKAPEADLLGLGSNPDVSDAIRDATEGGALPSTATRPVIEAIQGPSEGYVAEEKTPIDKADLDGFTKVNLSPSDIVFNPDGSSVIGGRKTAKYTGSPRFPHV